MRLFPIVVAAALAVVLAGAVAAQVRPTPTQAERIARGHRLAQDWCTLCHVVEDKATVGGAEGPSFSAIARSPRAQPAYLRTFLQAPHSRMPDLQLTREEIDNLVAYLLAQKR